MSHATVHRASARGPSSNTSPQERGRGAGVLGAARRAPGYSGIVVRARLRLNNGFYENPEVVSTALDRLLDDVTARFGRGADGPASGARGAAPAPAAWATGVRDNGRARKAGERTLRPAGPLGRQSA